MPRPAPSSALTFRDVDTLIDRDISREPSLSTRSLPEPVSPRREWFGAAWTCADCGGCNECTCCGDCGKAPDKCECRGSEPDSIQTLGLGGLVVSL